jgi:alpha-L-rhamnosidase
MNSFNHYAYGAIGDWMVRVVAGLDLDEAAPGYRHIIIHPEPGGGLTSARAELMTQYGSAASGWKLGGGQLSLDVRVPVNTHATVLLPGATLAQVTEGARAVASAAGVTSATQVGDAVVVEIGSGDYVFSYPKAPRSSPSNRQ